MPLCVFSDEIGHRPDRIHVGSLDRRQSTNLANNPETVLATRFLV